MKQSFLNFKYGYGERYKDVTSVICSTFLDVNGIIKVPDNTNYNLYFGNIYPGKLKNLKVSMQNSIEYLYIRENSAFEIDTTKAKNYVTPELICVYFVNCYINPLYMELVKSQFQDIKNNGLFSQFKSVYIEASISSDLAKSFEEELLDFLPGVKITCHAENIHEYPGIHKVWKLGQNFDLSEDSIILYFHSKGISRLRTPFERDEIEKRVFKSVIENYSEILPWFNVLTSIMKCGIHCGEAGWIWHNFWWAKVKYLRESAEPIITSYRYYYESWLSLHKNSQSYKNCMNTELNMEIGAFHIGCYYDPNTNNFSSHNEVSLEMNNTNKFFNQDNLDALSQKYGTDKSGKFHDYMRFYEFYLSKFKEDEFTLLELGVGPEPHVGASLFTWRDYFPNAQIIGVDIEPNSKKTESERIHIEIGDLGSLDFLAFLVKQYPTNKIVIDDASHLWIHQILSFEKLFSTVESGGVFIMEDIHTSFFPLSEHYRFDGEDTYSYFSKLTYLVCGMGNKHKFFEKCPPTAMQLTLAKQIEAISFYGKTVLIVKK
jgi:hypothetical protein